MADTQCLAWARQLIVHGSLDHPPERKDEPAVDALTDWIGAEGLSSLVLSALDEQESNSSLQARPSHWRRVRDRLQATEADRVAKTMLYEHEARRVVDVLAEAGIRSLLLKGVAISQWAYPASHLREYSDVDLVVPSYEEALKAANLLQQSGYRWVYTSHPLVGCELLCRRESALGYSVEIDLHWSASGNALTRHALPFDLLWDGSQALPSLGPNARGLGLIHAFLHACINFVSDVLKGEQDKPRSLYDLVALSKLFSEQDWVKLCELCGRQSISGFVASVMQNATMVWDAKWPSHVAATLSNAQPAEPFQYEQLRNWRYGQVMQFRHHKGLRNRLLWLWHKAFPSRELLRYKISSSQEGSEASYFALFFEHIQHGARQTVNTKNGQ